jgi:D-arabinose 1-dehydrogenase-like Zn-dependent alcohol dehydrogenase
MGLEITAFTSNPEKIEAIKALGAHEVVLVDKEYKSLEEF